MKEVGLAPCGPPDLGSDPLMLMNWPTLVLDFLG